MKLNCPNCTKAITSNHINIQQMVAVCPSCDTLFPFDPPIAKSKRRKIKQPKNLTLREDEDNLHMNFRTNFRLNENEDFIGISIVSVTFTFIMLLTAYGSRANDVPFLIPFGFALATMFASYLLGLMVYNKTHIDVKNEQIIVSRQPIPNPLTQPTKVNLSGVRAVQFEETAISKREGYDLPRFRVWADMEDGGQKTIIGDVPDDYALFISQRLNEYLAQDSPEFDGDETRGQGTINAIISQDQHQSSQS